MGERECKWWVTETGKWERIRNKKQQKGKRLCDFCVKSGSKKSNKRALLVTNLSSWLLSGISEWGLRN